MRTPPVDARRSRRLLAKGVRRHGVLRAMDSEIVGNGLYAAREIRSQPAALRQPSNGSRFSILVEERSRRSKDAIETSNDEEHR